jgi:hypothetical protein
VLQSSASDVYVYIHIYVCMYVGIYMNKIICLLTPSMREREKILRMPRGILNIQNNDSCDFYILRISSKVFSDTVSNK